MTTGGTPFPAVKKETLTKNNAAQFAKHLHASVLKFDANSISDELEDLISGMLEKNPSKRMTIENVLQHPWFD